MAAGTSAQADNEIQAFTSSVQQALTKSGEGSEA